MNYEEILKVYLGGVRVPCESGENCELVHNGGKR